MMVLKSRSTYTKSFEAQNMIHNGVRVSMGYFSNSCGSVLEIQDENGGFKFTLVIF